MVGLGFSLNADLDLGLLLVDLGFGLGADLGFGLLRVGLGFSPWGCRGSLGLFAVGLWVCLPWVWGCRGSWESTAKKKREMRRKKRKLK